MAHKIEVIEHFLNKHRCYHIFICKTYRKKFQYSISKETLIFSNKSNNLSKRDCSTTTLLFYYKYRHREIFLKYVSSDLYLSTWQNLNVHNFHIPKFSSMSVLFINNMNLNTGTYTNTHTHTHTHR